MTIDLSLLIVILNFVLLLLILNALLFKPISKFFTERQTQIQNDVDEAKKSIEKANLLVVEKEDELKQAHLDGRKIRDNVLKEAETQAEHLITRAKQHEKEIVAQGQNKVQEMENKAIDEIENELSGIIASLTSKVLFEKIDSEKDKELITRLLAKRGQ